MAAGSTPAVGPEVALSVEVVVRSVEVVAQAAGDYSPIALRNALGSVS